MFEEYNKLCKINISLSFVNINAVKPLKMATPWGMQIRPSLRTLQMQPTVLWVRQPEVAVLSSGRLERFHCILKTVGIEIMPFHTD